MSSAASSSSSSSSSSKQQQTDNKDDENGPPVSQIGRVSLLTIAVGGIGAALYYYYNNVRRGPDGLMRTARLNAEQGHRLLQQGDLKKASSSFESALVHGNANTPDAIGLVNITGTLARVRLQQGSLYEARRHYTSFLELYLKHGGTKIDTAVIEVSCKLAAIHARLGQNVEAEKGYRYAIESAEKRIVRGEERAAAKAAVAAAVTAVESVEADETAKGKGQSGGKGASERASELLKGLKGDAEARLQSVTGASTSSAIGVQPLDAAVHDGSDQDAVLLLGLALELYARFLVNNLRRPNEAIPLLKRSLSVAEQELGSDHSQVIVLLSQLADTYASLGNQSDALRSAQRAASLSEKTRQHEAVSYCNLATLLWEDDERTRALDYFERARVCAEKDDDREAVVEIGAILDKCRSDSEKKKS